MTKPLTLFVLQPRAHSLCVCAAVSLLLCAAVYRAVIRSSFCTVFTVLLPLPCCFCAASVLLLCCFCAAAVLQSTLQHCLHSAAAAGHVLHPSPITNQGTIGAAAHLQGTGPAGDVPGWRGVWVPRMDTPPKARRNGQTPAHNDPALQPRGHQRGLQRTGPGNRGGFGGSGGGARGSPNEQSSALHGTAHTTARHDVAECDVSEGVFRRHCTCSGKRRCPGWCPWVSVWQAVHLERRCSA